MVKMCKFFVVILLVLGTIAEDTSVNESTNKATEHNAKENSEGKTKVQSSQQSREVQKQGNTTKIEKAQNETQTQIKPADNSLTKNNTSIIKNQQKNIEYQMNNSTSQKSATNKNLQNNSVTLEQDFFDAYEFFELDDLFKPENKNLNKASHTQQNQTNSNNKNQTNSENKNQTNSENKNETISANKNQTISNNKNQTISNNSTKNQTVQAAAPKPKPVKANTKKDLEDFLQGLYDQNFDDIGDFQDYQYYGDYGYYGGYDFDGNFMQADKLSGISNEQDYFRDVADICYENDKGQTVVNASMGICDVKIEGVDKYPASFEGGIDGFYKVSGCYDERPVYIRWEPKNYTRVLWWSKFFGDWDISSGTTPNQDDILCHGGQGRNEELPNFVDSSSWALSKSKLDIYTQNEQKYNKVFELIKLNVTCYNRSQLIQPESSIFGKQPLLTDDEMEQQYRMIYDKYSNQKPVKPEINLVLVVMMVFAGMGVILGVPYMVVNRRNREINSGQGRNNESIIKTCQKLEKQRLRKI